AVAVGLLGGEPEYGAIAPLAEGELSLVFQESLDMLELPRECERELARKHVRTLEDCYVRALIDRSPRRREKAAYMLGMAPDRKKALSALLSVLENRGTQRLATIDSIRRLANIRCAQCGPRLQEVIDHEQELVAQEPSLGPRLQPDLTEMEIALAA